MQIIGITGKARSGKDTIGKWFRDHRHAYITHFAWPIKAGLAVMLSLDEEEQRDDRKEVELGFIGKSLRNMWQTLGTEWGRNLVHPDIWVIAMERKLRSSKLWYLDRCLIVIPDTRFENEAKWIRDNGGFVLHVHRDGAGATNGVEGHVSERGIEPKAGDLLVRNDGTIIQLYEKLDKMFPYDVYAQ